MAGHDDFDYSDRKRISEILNEIATELEIIKPAIGASGENIALAGLAIGALASGSSNSTIKEAPGNCEYARRWLLGYQTDGAKAHVDRGADLIRAVAGRIDPA